MKDKWYIKNIKKFIKEHFEKGISVILASLGIFFWYYSTGDTWEWETIEPVKVTFVTYAVSSAITFMTSGALFYALKVYQALHVIFVRWLGMYKLYDDIKYFIWILLNLITTFIVVPIIIAFINGISTLLYNMYTLLVYIFPGGAILLLVVGLYYLYKYIKNKK